MKRYRQVILILGIALIGLATGCKKNNDVTPEEDHILIGGRWYLMNAIHEEYEDGILIETSTPNWIWGIDWWEFKQNGVLLESIDPNTPIKWSINENIFYRHWGAKPEDFEEYKIVEISETKLTVRMLQFTFEQEWQGQTIKKETYRTDYFERVKI